MTTMRKITIVALSLSLLGCAGDPTANVASLEATPLVPALADPAKALTFARTKDTDGRVKTLLVTGIEGEAIQAVDLTPFGAPLDADVFDVMSAVGDAGLSAARRQRGARETYEIAALESIAGTGQRHVASGTNFKEHAKEAQIGEVFNFPKFGPATASRTSVVRGEGVLLDYEVEICARFDRDIRSAADFDAARKGFFLCGDFTDRAKLMRLVNPQDVGSGQGFSDAKSGADFFPTGPFLVVPQDWRAFIKAERMTTRINKENRQDARGGEMILDFRALVEKALTNGGGGHYTYRGADIPLLIANTIPRGAAVMSGTSEGVIFMPPHMADYLSGGARYIFTGPMLRGDTAFHTMVETFIAKEQASGRYLRPGDLVTHVSSSMGDVRVRVVSSSPSPKTAMRDLMLVPPRPAR